MEFLSLWQGTVSKVFLLIAFLVGNCYGYMQIVYIHVVFFFSTLIVML